MKAEIITPHIDNNWTSYSLDHNITIRYKWMMGFRGRTYVGKEHWNHSLGVL